MTLSALSMSQTKEELLRHLDMSPETYSLLASETDQIYNWLINSIVHLKSNSRPSPPYDWSDITERGKWDAMELLSQSKNPRTEAYWSLGQATTSGDSPNWIAKWFLYHKFRYRDGRNRVRDADKSSKGERHNKSSGASKSASSESSKKAGAKTTKTSQQGSSRNAGSGSSGASMSTTTPTSYTAPSSTTNRNDFVDDPGAAEAAYQEYANAKGLFFDPVKNAWVPK